jgi:RNA polymerase sigma-70 factor, ECF subfamily
MPGSVTTGASVTLKMDGMSTELGDTELVLRIGSGSDRDAEAELVRRMAPRIRLYGLRHLRDGHAAEDLTQQVLITTIEALRSGRLREPAKLVSFVLGTCRMTVLDMRRGDRRKERLLTQFGADLRPAPMPGPQLDRDLLVRCMQALRERERAVVVLSFYDERTAADVAGFLGVSQGNVRVIRHRAVQQLRECMETGRSAPRAARRQSACPCSPTTGPPRCLPPRRRPSRHTCSTATTAAPGSGR